jgi:hypothetical protein
MRNGSFPRALATGIDQANLMALACPVDAHKPFNLLRRPGCARCERGLDYGVGARPEVIGVAIEMTQGPVVEALLERGFCVYGINPKQLDQFRDRFTVTPAPKMIRATLTCWPTACALIGTPSGVCRTTSQ